MTVWDLSRIRYTVRKITGKFDVTQLPDTSPGPGEVNPSDIPSIDDYINDFYLFDLPEHLRTLKLRDYFFFTTIPNCGTYSIPQNVLEVYSPIYIDNYEFNYYQYPDQFYKTWPELNFIDRNLFTPDGITATFNFTLTQTPIQQGTVVIGLQPNVDGSTFQNMETFKDEDSPIPLDIPKQQYFRNPRTLTGNQGGTGSINYLTGAVTITYANAPPNGALSSCHYHPYVPSRSRDILMWQQQLFIRPIPNDTYLVKMMAYMMPTTVISAATNSTVRPSILVDPATTPTSAPTNTTVQIQGFNGSDTGATPNPLSDLPQFNEFWQMIAYGTALKIMIEDGDYQEAATLKPIFEEQKLLAQRKTLRQLAHQRMPTRYAQGDDSGGSNQWPIFPLY